MLQCPSVEQSFLRNTSRMFSTKIPYISMENSSARGMLTTLHFLEWVAESDRSIIDLCENIEVGAGFINPDI